VPALGKLPRGYLVMLLPRSLSCGTLRLHRPDRALTLIELVVVIAILGVLAVLGNFAMTHVRARTELANCTANLKSLYTAFATYVNDKGQWPQISIELNGRPYELQWLNALQSYGIAEKNWRCPTIAREGQEPPLIHYTPTHFDEHPLTPFKWPNQPWLTEIGDAHGRGPMTILTSGAVRPFNDIYVEAGGKL
jgi:prepilin-type N-terminal cleavage/methylation domain-containing protein